MKGLATVQLDSPGSSPSAGPIWGRSFVATSVAGEVGGHRLLSGPIHARIWFSSEPQHSVSWRVGCNGYGADVHITADRIIVGLIGGTLVACSSGGEEGWFSQFMESDPGWHLEGERLRLVFHSFKIELKGLD